MDLDKQSNGHGNGPPHIHTYANAGTYPDTRGYPYPVANLHAAAYFYALAYRYAVPYQHRTAYYQYSNTNRDRHGKRNTLTDQRAGQLDSDPDSNPDSDSYAIPNGGDATGDCQSGTDKHSIMASLTSLPI